MTLARRIMLAFALLLAIFGALVAVLGRSVAAEREAETLQRLSHGLARHIVEHWPQVTQAGGAQAERESLLQMLMTVNPGIEVYMLDAQGRVAHYLGDPSTLRGRRIELAPVREFLAGAPLPLRGTDPKEPGAPKLFSAAMFPPKPGELQPPGYLYVLLEGQVRADVAGTLAPERVLEALAAAAALAMGVTLAVGALVSLRLTRPLRRLATRMRAYGSEVAARPQAAAQAPVGDEVRAIERAFGAMVARLARQAGEQAAQQAAHREVIADVAHDLRTPLTVLHAHLEALGTARTPAETARHQQVALAHSDKVRALSQQLFELAMLQSTDAVLQRERFRLDELVMDSVQKFALAAPQPAVALSGPAPGRIEFEGDLHLIERALTNLIGNALRHAPGDGPVSVSLRRDGASAQVLVEDHGPGLPAELARRLDAGQPVRDPPLQRAGGGVGGLGLAIAQRVAWLHGGRLSTLPTAGGGTRLCLALPLTGEGA